MGADGVGTSEGNTAAIESRSASPKQVDAPRAPGVGDQGTYARVVQEPGRPRRRRHFGYFGIRGNAQALARLRDQMVKIGRTWLDRRSQEPRAHRRKPLMTWVHQNAHRFGIVLTYDRDKEKITQYQWEPWHYRFVGVAAADPMRRCHLSTEEYLNARYSIGPLPRHPDAARLFSRAR